MKILGERLGNEGLKLGDLAPHMGDEVQLCQLLVELGFHSALDRMAIRRAVKQQFAGRDSGAVCPAGALGPATGKCRLSGGCSASEASEASTLASSGSAVWEPGTQIWIPKGHADAPAAGGRASGRRTPSGGAGPLPPYLRSRDAWLARTPSTKSAVAPAPRARPAMARATVPAALAGRLRTSVAGPSSPEPMGPAPNLSPGGVVRSTTSAPPAATAPGAASAAAPAA